MYFFLLGMIDTYSCVNIHVAVIGGDQNHWAIFLHFFNLHATSKQQQLKIENVHRFITYFKNSRDGKLILKYLFT